MNDVSSLRPNMLFEEFRKAQKDVDFGRRALNNFSALKDKETFLEPIIKFLSQEEQDQVRSWGTNVLEMIRGDRAFSFLIDLLREADSKEIKRNYRYTRFFALRAIARLASSDSQQEQLLSLSEQIWKDIDEDYLIRAEASILLAKQGRSEPLVNLREMLGKFEEDDYWAPARALRALRESPLPNLADEIILVMRNSRYLEHQHDAIRVLGSYTDNIEVVRTLGDVVITSRNRYLRLAAVASLAQLNNPASQADLVNAIHDEDAEIREQASDALKSLLSKEGAVSAIVHHMMGEKIEAEHLTYMIDAIRRIDKDRTFSTEILSKELGSEDKSRADLAQRILIDLGGWAAIQRLSQRRSTLDALDELLAKSEDVVKSNFEDTIRQARLNFYFAMGVNILVVATGLILVVLAILQFIQKPEKLETWIIPGGAGALGVLINLVFNNPRRNAREDLAALVDVNVIFLGFLRQLNEIDATFKHAYLENRDFGTNQMHETVKQIDDTVAQTLKKAYQYLRQQPTETIKD